jgi:hypothetical protein
VPEIGAPSLAEPSFEYAWDRLTRSSPSAQVQLLVPGKQPLTSANALMGEPFALRGPRGSKPVLCPTSRPRVQPNLGPVMERTDGLTVHEGMSTAFVTRAKSPRVAT